MILGDILIVKERPKKWSASSYYRLRSFCGRVSKVCDVNIEISDENIEEVLTQIKLPVLRKGKFPTRTLSTYISELRRYYKYKKNKLANGNKK